MKKEEGKGRSAGRNARFLGMRLGAFARVPPDIDDAVNLDETFVTSTLRFSRALGESG